MNFTEEHFDRLCLILYKIYHSGHDALSEDDLDLLDEIAVYSEELLNETNNNHEWSDYYTEISDAIRAEASFAVAMRSEIDDDMLNDYESGEE